jgi:hypothetical protein
MRSSSIEKFEDAVLTVLGEIPRSSSSSAGDDLDKVVDALFPLAEDLLKMGRLKVVSNISSAEGDKTWEQTESSALLPMKDGNKSIRLALSNPKPSRHF